MNGKMGWPAAWPASRPTSWPAEWYFIRFCIWKHIWSWKSRVHSRVLALFGARIQEWMRLFHDHMCFHSPNQVLLAALQGSFLYKFPYNSTNIWAPPRAPALSLTNDLVDTESWRPYPTTRTSAPTLPSRAHLKDDVRSRPTPSK